MAILPALDRVITQAEPLRGILVEKGVRERSQNPSGAGLRSERLGDPGAQPTARAEASGQAAL